VLVGHSYGGVVITEAGNQANVAALVYVAAFAPDRGESVSALIANPVPGAPVPPILPPQDGALLLDRARFAASVRGRSRRGQGGVPGRLAGAVGRRRARGRGQRPGVEAQAQLVSRRDRRPHDPARGAARDGAARRLDGGRRSPAATRSTCLSPRASRR
jgi:pimeloyl-ACP methyl ester carboxylesterase